ncbi:hypothetical protein Tco_0609510 [Tanacetum coccineum]
MACGRLGKGTRKPNLDGRRAGMIYPPGDPEPQAKSPYHDKNGPRPLNPVEYGDQREPRCLSVTMLLIWDNYSSGASLWDFSVHHPTFLAPSTAEAEGEGCGKDWHDFATHMESDRWPKIYAGIQQHLQKLYNGKKDALKERYWVPNEDGT